LDLIPLREALWREILQATTTESRPIHLGDDLFHVIGTVNLAALLAERRGVNRDMAVAAMLLHDIGRLQSGVTPGHAELSTSLARPLLSRAGFSRDQVDSIARAIETHVDKAGKGDALEELVRDADVLDGYLSGSTLSGAALVRAQALRAELGLGSAGP
jgi:uncharacterized protein